MAKRKFDPVHPSVMLAEDFLKGMEISQYRLAKGIGVSPVLWLNLPVDYDLRVAKRATWLKAEPRVRVHAE